MKSKALDMLGETSLQLPAAMAAALAANDAVKGLFSHLQDRLRADDHPVDLGGPRDEIFGQMETMLVPFAANGAAQPEFARRFQALRDSLLALPPDTKPAMIISMMTTADRQAGDSLHLLVMDTHRALNQLQTQMAEDSIDGAAVYHLGPDDPPLVHAFMTGLNRTAPLKFDHPGLGTTATRAGDSLLIQNDIGTTDAHIIVIHVDPDAIRLTYSDVHLERLQFFRSLFPGTLGTWSDPQIREDRALAENEPFYLTVACFPATDGDSRQRLLEWIGSRLVFLIDWNKGRKRLRTFVDNDRAIALLGWAAQENIGHRGFLQLGAERLIFDAVEAASGGQVRYGETLSDMLGAERTVDFLKFTLRACAEGLLAGRSESLIRDQIRAELISHFHSREQQMLDLAVDHAGYILHIADLVRGALADWGSGAGDKAEVAQRAKQWERAADEKLMTLRSRAHGKPEALLLCLIVENADDAADDLEEAAYLISLLTQDAPRESLLGPLQDLAGLLVEDAREWVKLLATASRLYLLADREQSDDFLVAADALARLERDTDHAERRVKAALATDPPPVANFFLFASIAQALEQAADDLMRAGFRLHDHMLTRIRP